MAWRIRLDEAAKKDLSKLDKAISRRITAFIRQRLTKLEDPRSIGDALKGAELGSFWKNRVGDYRLIASIEDDILRILVVRIGDRKDVYRN